MDTQTIIIVILILIIGLMAYLMRNLIKNNQTQATAIKDLEELLDEKIYNNEFHFENSVSLLKKCLELFTQAKQRIDKIDKQGAFSSDDEVGFAFKLINSVIIEVADRLMSLKEIADGKEEKSK